MTNAMISILTLLISSFFWMAAFLVSLLMAFTFLNFFGLQVMSSHLADSNARNNTLTAKLLQQGYVLVSLTSKNFFLVLSSTIRIGF